MAGEVMCGGRSLAASGAHGWCVWCGPCPQTAGGVDEVAGCQLLKTRSSSIISVLC